MIALLAGVGSAFVLLIDLVRLFTGPTLHDRVLAANAGATKLAVICAAWALATENAAAIDVALALTFALLAVNAAAAKAFRFNSFQAPVARGDDV